MNGLSQRACPVRVASLDAKVDNDVFLCRGHNSVFTILKPSFGILPKVIKMFVTVSEFGAAEIVMFFKYFKRMKPCAG